MLNQQNSFTVVVRREFTQSCAKDDIDKLFLFQGSRYWKPDYNHCLQPKTHTQQVRIPQYISLSIQYYRMMCMIETNQIKNLVYSQQSVSVF